MVIVSRMLGLADTAKRLVRGLGLRVLDDVARRGELAGLARRIGDVNARLATLEPHGPAHADACGVCSGPVHLIARDVPGPLYVMGLRLRCDIWRCARCFALRPVASKGGGDASGVTS